MSIRPKKRRVGTLTNFNGKTKHHFDFEFPLCRIQFYFSIINVICPLLRFRAIEAVVVSAYICTG